MWYLGYSRGSKKISISDWTCDNDRTTCCHELLVKRLAILVSFFLFENFDNLFNFQSMKESLKKILILIWIMILLWFVFYFLIDVKFWPWYEKQQEKEEFNFENFFDNLKVISWTIFEWPSQELYSQYGKFLDSTDEYIKLETYDFTNNFFKTRFKNLSNRWTFVQIILENNKYQQYQNTFRQLQEYFSWN